MTAFETTVIALLLLNVALHFKQMFERAFGKNRPLPREDRLNAYAEIHRVSRDLERLDLLILRVNAIHRLACRIAKEMGIPVDPSGFRDRSDHRE